MATASRASTARTYKVFFIGSNNGYAIRANSLNALRKRLVREYGKVWLDVYLGYDHIANYRCERTPEWWIVGSSKARWYDIDPRTGKIGIADASGRFSAYVDENGRLLPAQTGRR